MRNQFDIVEQTVWQETGQAKETQSQKTQTDIRWKTKRRIRCKYARGQVTKRPPSTE